MKEFGLPWIAHLLLLIFVGPIWGGIIRIVRGNVIVGVLHIITFGFFGILWIIDVVTMFTKKDITVLV